MRFVDRSGIPFETVHMAKHARRTIGLFLDNFYGEYGCRVWAGASGAAEELGATLISFMDGCAMLNPLVFLASYALLKLKGAYGC